jgi:RNA polymerase sigma factor (sigma-70 family)
VSHIGSEDRRSDQELWEAAVSGQAEAFGVLFDRYHRLIYNFCFRRTASWSSAEDLVAVVFLEAWRTRRHMQLESGVLPWLYGIATNATRRQHRSAARHRDALARLASRWVDVPDVGDEVAGRLADEQRMADVRAAMQQLPSRERDVLELAVFAELDYAQISTALGVPVGTVRSRLSRGRSRLRRLVGDRDNHDEPEEAYR